VRRFWRKDIRGSRALITGGGSGLGRRLAHGLAREGCDIVLWDINEDGMVKVADEIRQQNPQCAVKTYRVNVADYTNVASTAQKVLSDAAVDIVVNNAGIVSGKFLLDLTEEHITRTFAVNTLGPFWVWKSFLPSMIANNKGHLVTIASAGGVQATTGLVDYCASKFAVFGANEALRLELGKQKKNIDTLVVCPFYINTGMFEGVKSKIPMLLPILDEQYVAGRIIDSIIHRDGQLLLPETVRLAWLQRLLLPVSWLDWMSRLTGISDSMTEFKGRGWEATDPSKKSPAKKND